MAELAHRFLCGVDTGGTFTDCVAIDEMGRIWSAKTPSTPPDFADGFFTGLTLLAAEVGLSLDGLLSRTEQLVHGTTVATNALVERRGATVGLIATRGHRDAIFVMRGIGRVAGLTPDQTMRTLETGKPDPLVSKRRAIEVTERIDWRGDVVVELDEDEARAAIRELVDDGARSIAIALLWGFRNPVHERRLAQLVHEIVPDLHISQAHEIAPRTGEYERTAATVIDAYIKPATVGHLREVERRCREEGYNAPLLVMQCDGNVAPIDVVLRAPLLTLQSGPAAGLEAARVMGSVTVNPNVIAVDMGGTTCDVGLIVDGSTLRRTTSIVSQYEYFTPSVEIESIGVGGGSIAWVDEVSGSLRVGPRSAGADPGPACYGHGGVEATVTDADLVLGRLDPNAFLGGRMQVDRGAAEAAIGRLANRLALAAAEVAGGISRLAELQIAEEIRKLTVARGYDPRNFVIFAYGGAGPVHAGAVARELGLARVIVPLRDLSSLWSAFGAATSDLGTTAEISINASEPFDCEAVASGFETVRRRAAEALEGVNPRGGLKFIYAAALRYRAQVNEVWVACDRVPATIEDLDGLVAKFEAEYEALFGRGTGYRQAGIEIAALRCVATILRLPDKEKLRLPPTTFRGNVQGHRPVYWDYARGYVDTRVVAGSALLDEPIDGAAIVEFEDTTVVVEPGQRAGLDAFGNIVVEVAYPSEPNAREIRRAKVGIDANR